MYIDSYIVAMGKLSLRRPKLTKNCQCNKSLVPRCTGTGAIHICKWSQSPPFYSNWQHGRLRWKRGIALDPVPVGEATNNANIARGFARFFLSRPQQSALPIMKDRNALRRRWIPIKQTADCALCLIVILVGDENSLCILPPHSQTSLWIICPVASTLLFVSAKWTHCSASKWREKEREPAVCAFANIHQRQKLFV